MAEIRQKIISCSQGHYYDANRYDQCPYCSAGGFSPTIDPFAAGESKPGSTVGPLTPGDVPHHAGDVQVGSFTPTIDPNQPGGLSERMGKTQYVDASTPRRYSCAGSGLAGGGGGSLPGHRLPHPHWLATTSAGRRATSASGADSTISAQRDANVTYVPQTREFYIAHELGKNVLLVNGKPVIGGSTKLENYDRITIGTTQLVICGPVRGAVCLGQRGAGA